MMKTKLFVDLDDTLINTTWLKQELIRIICDMGVTREVVLRRYEDSKDKNGIPVIARLASSFVDYNIIPENLRLRIESLYSNMDESKLYMDKLAWIEENFPREQYEYILLTKGEDDAQHRKMDNFNLKALFDRVIVVTENKSKALEQLVAPGMKFVVIDDKKSELSRVQDAYPESQLLISPAEGNPQPYYENQEEEPSHREG